MIAAVVTSTSSSNSEWNGDGDLFLIILTRRDAP